jgi:hypothetical protein
MDNLARTLLVPAATALLLAACGSSGSSSDTTAAAATTAATTAAPTTAAPTTAAAATTVAPPTSAGSLTESVPTDVPAEGDAVEIIINVDDPAQVGKTFPVPLGKTVVLRLLSDTDQTYHVHGYDLEQKAAAGVEASFEFTADQAGEFEVESHTTDKVLAILQVA